MHVEQFRETNGNEGEKYKNNKSLEWRNSKNTKNNNILVERKRRR